MKISKKMLNKKSLAEFDSRSKFAIFLTYTCLLKVVLSYTKYFGSRLCIGIFRL